MQKHQESVMNNQKRCNLQGPCANVFASGNTGSWRLERPVINFSECIRCGTCVMYCPANVITLNKEKEECIEIMWDYCKGCGICANECPKHCIRMVDERSVKNGLL